MVVMLNSSFSQEAAAQLTILNALTLAFKEAEAHQDEVKMAKLAQQISSIKKTYETTKDIYSYYQKTVEAVETVSNLIKTSVEVKEFFENLFEIIDLYSKYGIGYSFSSLYDLDKYLSPQQQEKYANSLKEVYDNSMDLSDDMKMMINNKSEGGASATEYQRFTEVNKLNKDMKVLLYKMRKVVYTMQILAPMRNSSAKSNVELKKSFYSYETYD